MKNLLGVLALASLLLSCTEDLEIRKYTEYENSLEKQNLYGKVKSFELRKAKVINLQTSETDEPVLEELHRFNEDGNLLSRTYFRDGQKAYEMSYEYNGEGNRIALTSNDFTVGESSTELYRELNQDGDPTYIEVMNGDTVAASIKLGYDEQGELNSQVFTENGTTSGLKSDNSYDEKGNQLVRKEYTLRNPDELYSQKAYTYNEYNQILTFTDSNSIYGVLLTTYEYDEKQRVNKISVFKNGEVQEESWYNDKFYPIKTKRYQPDGEVQVYQEFEYKYDDVGNWTERKSLMQSQYTENELLPVQVEFRSYTYY